MSDLIDRQAAIDMIRLYREDEAVDLDELESSIAMMPSVQPEVPDFVEWRACETCRYNGLNWDDEPCDSCTNGGENNHWKPSAQPELIEQIRWERDIAIEQLNELGYSFGEKIRTDGDTISRKAAIDAIQKERHEAWEDLKDDTEYRKGYDDGLAESMRILTDDLPPAQPDSSFITWLLDEIWDEDMWALNCGAFPEIVCRKLTKLGYVRERNGEYERLNQQTGGNRCGL